jgi:hypothetical protein
MVQSFIIILLLAGPFVALLPLFHGHILHRFLAFAKWHRYFFFLAFLLEREWERCFLLLICHLYSPLGFWKLEYGSAIFAENRRHHLWSLDVCPGLDLDTVVAADQGDPSTADGFGGHPLLYRPAA